MGLEPNRRRFLKLFGAGVAGIAFKQAIPFNRVWSFPKKIVLPMLRFSVDRGQTWAGVDFAWGAYHDIVIQETWTRYGDGAVIRELAIRQDDGTYKQIALNEVLNVPFVRYSGAPPGAPPVAQFQSARVPLFDPDRGIPES